MQPVPLTSLLLPAAPGTPIQVQPDSFAQHIKHSTASNSQMQPASSSPWSDWLCCDLDHSKDGPSSQGLDSCADCLPHGSLLTSPKQRRQLLQHHQHQPHSDLPHCTSKSPSDAASCCDAAPCDIVPCEAVPCDALPCDAIPCDAPPYQAVTCEAPSSHCTSPHGATSACNDAGCAVITHNRCDETPGHGKPAPSCSSECDESTVCNAQDHVKIVPGKAQDCPECKLHINPGSNRVYSSFQELLDCCCCCPSPAAEGVSTDVGHPVEQRQSIKLKQQSVATALSDPSEGSAPHIKKDTFRQPVTTVSKSEEDARTLNEKNGMADDRQAHNHLGTPSSMTLASSQRTPLSPGITDHSRSSTISPATTPHPFTDFSAPRFNSSQSSEVSRLRVAPPHQRAASSVGERAFSHYPSLSPSPLGDPQAQKFISNQAMALLDGCTFDHPHRHSEDGVCIPPSWTLCNSSECATDVPHSHWMSMMAPHHGHSHGRHDSTHLQSANMGFDSSGKDAKPQMCQWGGCNERFWTVEELVAHVNHSHLSKKPTVTNHNRVGSLSTNQGEHGPGIGAPVNSPAGLSNSGPSENSEAVAACMWNDCNMVPWPQMDVGLDELGAMLKEIGTSLPAEGVDLNGKSSAAMLQHLLSDHLGPMSQQHSTHHHSDSGYTSAKADALGKRKREQHLVHGHLESDPVQSPSQGHVHRTARSMSMQSNQSDFCCDNVKIGHDGRKGHYCGWEGCAEMFPDHESLTEHITNVHVGSGKATYECRWIGCERFAEGKKFGQKQKVLRHIQTHTGDRPHKCEICGRRFSEANTLAQHMRTHTHEKPYVCDYPGCGKAFSVAGSLTIHKRVHSGAKPFKCKFPGCGKAFAESSNLTKHARIHSGEKPFSCQECGKRFSRPDQVSRHRKTHDKKRAKARGGIANAPGQMGAPEFGAISSSASDEMSGEEE